LEEHIASIQCWRINQARNQHEGDCFRCWSTFSGLYAIISQKTETLITTAVRISNPTYFSMLSLFYKERQDYGIIHLHVFVYICAFPITFVNNGSSFIRFHTSNMSHPASCLFSTQVLIMPELQLWKCKMRESLTPFNIMLKFLFVKKCNWSMPDNWIT
jgi:hypothetical protein